MSDHHASLRCLPRAAIGSAAGFTPSTIRSRRKDTKRSTTPPADAHGWPGFFLIGPGEWIAAAVWCAALLGAVALLHVEGYLGAPAGWRYSGFIGPYLNDYNGYLAWIRQARDGWVLFRDQFTTEPHGRVFFHPLFWLMGAASRVTGLPLMTVWYLVQALASAGAILALYRFISHFTPDPLVRAASLGLSTTAAGLGWLVGAGEGLPWEQRPMDLWMPEAGTFHALATSFFTLPAALAMMLMAFTRALRYFRTGWLDDAVAAGGWALGLTMVHPYDLTSFLAVLAVYALLFARDRIAGALLIAAIPLPYALYAVAVVTYDPVFSAQRQAGMESPPPTAALLGWGVPLVLAAVALVVPAVWRSGRDVGFLAVWLGVGLILTRLPVGFERKLAWGLQIPQSLLSALLAAWLMRSVAERLDHAWLRRVVAVAGMGALVVFCAVGSASLYLQSLRRLESHGLGDYIPEEYVQAFSWLETNSTPQDIILAGTEIAPMIPGRTGRAVFAGHWAQTIDPQGKDEFIRFLFGPPSPALPARVLPVLRRNQVRWIVLDAASRSLYGLPDDDGAIGASQIGAVRFHNGWVTIWSVEGDGQPPPRWRSGDWRTD